MAPKRAVFQKKLNGALFYPKTRMWVAPRKVPCLKNVEVRKLLTVEWQLERAKSDRSTCRRCGGKIEKDAFRMAYPSANQRLEYGCCPSWLHLSCAAAVVEADDDFSLDGSLEEKVFGYACLSDEEKATFREQLVPVDEKKSVSKDFPRQKRCTEEMDPPACVKAILFPYQKEGLAWMVAQEMDPATRGGILADEMGMGKTLQTICTMLVNQQVTLVVCPSAAVLQWRNEILRFAEGSLIPIVYHGDDRNMKLKSLTCNTVVITTYQTMECEYRKIAMRYKLACEWCGRPFLSDKLVIHQKYFCGPNAVRTAALKKTARKDEAVKMMKVGGAETNIQLHYPLTALRSVMRKDMHEKRPFMHIPTSTLPKEGLDLLAKFPKKKKEPVVLSCSSAEQEVGIDTLHTPILLPTKRLRSKTSLTCGKKQKTSTVVAQTWGKKLKKSNKIADVSRPIDLCDSSTHSDGEIALVRSTNRAKSGDVEDWGLVDLSSSPFFSTKWGRVVLDEAHRIKSRTNSTATAAYCLQADLRWCLSGTPLQNKIGELYSLVRFIRFHPYAHYRCKKKGCDCESLHYRFDSNAKCLQCRHVKMYHTSTFQQSITGPITRYGDIGLGKEAFSVLQSQVMDRLCLRRTKKERDADLNLPPMHIRIRTDELSKEELDFYNSMFMQCVTEFDTYVDSGTLLHNYAHVFDLLMRLRQAVDHPYLIIHGSLNAMVPSKSRAVKSMGVCALCQDGIQSGVTAKCGHSFHKECVEEYIVEAPTLASGDVGCPSCFTPLTIDFDNEVEFGSEADASKSKRKKLPSIMDKIDPDQFQSSTKIEALVSEINTMLSKNQTSKALVFSQFIRFLDLIEWRLKRDLIGCAKVTGAINIQARNNIIMDFNVNPNMKILLISLKAGGEGLNLQAADHVFIMDPWWNPAAEQQAMQRAHRIGQTRELMCTRFFTSNTIEDKIMALQNKKQIAFDVAIDGKTDSLNHLTSEDLLFLFQR